MSEQVFSLDRIQWPFRLDLTAWALRRKAVNEVDQWDGETYSRVIVERDEPVMIKITQSENRLQVKAISDGKIKNIKSKIGPIVERMLGLNVDLRKFYRLAKNDEKLSALTSRFLGLKPPRFPSVFEAIVNGIACQQLSLHVGLILLNRLATKCGLAIENSQHSFPRPECLKHLSPAQFRKLGFSHSKALAIKNLARVYDHSLKPDRLEELNDDKALVRLEQLRGVGRWTAEYVLLRGLGRLNVFPGDDVGARSKLKRWLGLRKDLDYIRVKKVLERWQPFAGLIYFHLLLDGLEKEGYLNSPPDK